MAKLAKNKKGFEMQFHWIFILIAGAVILAFFFSISLTQKEAGDQLLTAEISKGIEAVLTGAGVSGNTAQELPMPTKEFWTHCTNTCPCSFGVGDRNSVGRISYNDKAIFAPETISEDSEMRAWALEWDAPFRIMNFLYITSPDIRKIIVASEDDWKEFNKTWPRNIKVELVRSSSSINIDEEENAKIIFINSVPSGSEDIGSNSVSAVAIDTSESIVRFYEKSGSRLVLNNTLPFYSGAIAVGAMFAGDSKQYECNIRMFAMKRLYYEALILSNRAGKISSDQCPYNPTYFDNIAIISDSLRNEFTVDKMNELRTSISSLINADNYLNTAGCIALY